MAAWHRQRRVLLRASRAAWRLEQAERERSWALASARAEGISIRTLASAAGLSPARVHQITAAADMDELDAALGGLRAAGWPAPPEDPDGDDDAELDGRDLICDRLLDEVGWLRQCAGWLTHLHTKVFPSAVKPAPRGRPPREGARGGRPAPGGGDKERAVDLPQVAGRQRLAGTRVRQGQQQGQLRTAPPGERNKLGEASLARRWPGLALPGVSDWGTTLPGTPARARHRISWRSWRSLPQCVPLSETSPTQSASSAAMSASAVVSSFQRKTND